MSKLTCVVHLAGWPTPCQQDGPKGGPSQGADRLPAAAALSGWQTPKVARGEYQYANGDKTKIQLNLEGEVKLSGWATPTSRDHKDGEECPNVPINSLLGRDVWLAGWATPTASEKVWSVEFKDGRQPNVRECLPIEGPARRTASGEILTGSSAAMPSGGRLSPAHSLWLMLGPFGTAWACCGERVTRSTSPRRRRSSKRTET